MTSPADETTADRVARNQDAFRQANERITAAAAGAIDGGFESIPVICECPQPACTAIARLTPEQYEQVRSNGRTFLVVPGHEITVVEGATVARVDRKFDAFSVMEKVGAAGAVAERLDSRGAD
jgi:2-keto-3-deoxy-6-phosphogluconate aldolase